MPKTAVLGFDALGASACCSSPIESMLKQNEIVVDGDVFDAHKILLDYPHPGGEMILWAGGMESSALFFSMHPRASHQLLKSEPFRKKYLLRSGYPKSPLSILDPFYLQAKALVSDATRKYDPILIFGWTLSVYVWWVLCYLYMLSTNTLLASFLCAGATAVLNFNTMHLSMHGSITAKEPWKTLLDYAYCYAGGGSPVAWRRKHCLGHHVITNDVHDPDKLAQPMIRLHPNQPFRWWYRYQTVYFPFLAMLNILVNQFTHVARLYKAWGAIPRKDQMCLIAGYTFWYATIYGVPIWVWGWEGAFLGFRTIAIASVITTYTIVVNHLFEGARVTQSLTGLASDSWAKRQVEGSSNFNPDSLIALYLSGGLNLQIEHHLFPRLHPIQLFRIQAKLEDFCLQNNLRYSKLSYLDLIMSTHKCLHQYGQNEH